MRKESSSASRDVSVARSPHARPVTDPRNRSRVTNGKALHVVSPGDTKYSRRFRDILAQITSDLGGGEILSEAQRQLARRAATISLSCEQLEFKAVSGEAIDLDVYGQLTDRLGRVFGRLGLKRIARDVQSLDGYIAELYAQTEDEEANEAAEEAQDAVEAPPETETAPEIETLTGSLPTGLRRHRPEHEAD
jgi:hypothetical protein